MTNNNQRNPDRNIVEALPSSWKMCRLGDLMYLKNGYAFKSQDYSLDGIPLVRISDINEGRVTLEKAVYIPEDKANFNFVIYPGDLLIAMSGATTGKTGVYNGFHLCLQNQRVGNFYIISEDTVDKKYRNYYIVSLREEIEKAAYGGAQPNISGKDIEALNFPLPPLNEQELIVAEIEKQFSRLDEAVANLKRIKANLKRYKASVLKSAVEGKLTEEWRKGHPDVEPASELLGRILSARRKKWEETELTKMKAKGKGPKDDKWKGKYKKPIEPALDSYPYLPSTWTWATIEQLSSDEPRSIQSGPFGSNLKHSEFQENGILVIGIDNVQDGYFSIGSGHRISESKFKQLEKYEARPGDVLITVMATVGRTCVVPENLEKAIITKHVYRITVNRHMMVPDYLHLALWGGSFVRNQMFDQVIGQTRPGLNGTIIRSLVIPLPPLDEQILIAESVKKDLSMIDNVYPSLIKQEIRSAKLRQSILKKAFSGKLVPQEKTAEA